MHFPDLEVCCDWSNFFPLKSADVRGEGTRDASLRMSAGEAKRSRKSGKLHKLTARAIDCKTVGFFPQNRFSVLEPKSSVRVRRACETKEKNRLYNEFVLTRCCRAVKNLFTIPPSL